MPLRSPPRVIQSLQLAVGLRPTTRIRSLLGHCDVAESTTNKPIILGDKSKLGDRYGFHEARGSRLEMEMSLDQSSQLKDKKWLSEKGWWLIGVGGVGGGRRW
ncbi:hypothetical protein L6452_03019 [Arctium lappa]|uniref:Uncharacterized protein n=1 Tax=Arctium lappa TaxID=4217 RepID=A0ACB9FKI1_ARCLA|nr:hypothetical protein L6452_03019 [Arctium lappa]